MNIFYLDHDPIVAARQHCDKHVVKMILETGQLLSTTHSVLGSLGVCKATHHNHGCRIWVGKTRQNYEWLARLGIALCDEKMFRYGTEHSWRSKLEWLAGNIPPNLPDIGFTPPYLAVSENLKCVEDPVEAYRAYYIQKKCHFATWKKRQVPQWFLNGINMELK